eukprot:8582164-Alexandrium_andersonii.AAC.1
MATSRRRQLARGDSRCQAKQPPAMSQRLPHRRTAAHLAQTRATQSAQLVGQAFFVAGFQ